MKRIKISVAEFNALARLCSVAGCDRFCKEYRNSKTIDAADLDCLYAHWFKNRVCLTADEKNILINLFKMIGHNPEP